MGQAEKVKCLLLVMSIIVSGPTIHVIRFGWMATKPLLCQTLLQDSKHTLTIMEVFQGPDKSSSAQADRDPTRGCKASVINISHTGYLNLLGSLGDMTPPRGTPVFGYWQKPLSIPPAFNHG